MLLHAAAAVMQQHQKKRRITARTKKQRLSAVKELLVSTIGRLL